MIFRHLVQRFCQSQSRHRSSRQRMKYQRQISLELLEGRALLSTLNIDAFDHANYTASTNNTLTILLEGSQTEFDDTESITLNGPGFHPLGDPHRVIIPSAAISSSITTQNPTSYTRLNIDDSADPTARTVTLDTIGNFGRISGLAPETISYKYADTSSVSVTTGHGADTVNVRATGVSTALSTSGGGDTVNVGNAGSVQGILGTLSIENPPSHDTISVDDSADTTARTVTLSTFVNPADSEHNSDPWGSITGLAPAAINYEYRDTSSVSVTTGHGADTVNVRATGVSTALSTSGGGDTVNVGNAGSVQGILGTLSIENPPSHDTISVDDSADTTARTVTLSTFVNPADSEHNSDPWGSITGLAPAAINYEYRDTSSVSVTTGHGADTVNVRATGVSTR